MSSSRIRVAVLRGGPSHEYDASLATGGRVLSLLSEMPEKYEPVDIFISRSGDWHYWGLVRTPAQSLKHVDIVWNALHGPYGEDGQIQEILEGLGVPFTGADKSASALSSDRHESGKTYFLNGISIPNYKILSKESFDSGKLIEIFRNYMMPVIIKPADFYSPIRARKASSYGEFEKILKEIFLHSSRAVVEEMIRGREVSCAALDRARDQDLYAFMPIEKKAANYEYSSNLNQETIKKIEDVTRSAHQALGMRHYSVSDFVVTPNGKTYLLNTTSSPRLAEDSLMQKSFDAAGWQARDFVDHVIEIARQ